MRAAALLVPLASVRTRAQAGIAAIPDIPALADFARACGCSAIQLLPLGEPVAGDTSPYASRSTFALDPIYIGLRAVEDLDGVHGPWEADLDRVRGAPRIELATVRAAKMRALEAAFARFLAREWKAAPQGGGGASRRAEDFRRFMDEHAFWLDDYALFRALEEAAGGASWPAWPPPLRDRNRAALAERRADLEDRVLFFRWLQWLAGTQWAEARRAAAARGVRIAGDLPFMVATDSADVWARRDDFRLDASIGAPPDALAPEGQDWGLPAYRWDAHARSGFAWVRERARRSAELYDLYRIDHVVGYYRTYVIPRDGGPKGFDPPDEPSQRAQGERVLTIMREAGAEIIAEDLGTIPPFVRRSLEALRVPGYRVLRWERLWDAPGQPWIDPRTYPACSVATSGTHDTSTLAVWWEKELAPHERAALCEVPALERLRGAGPEFTPAVHEALLDALEGAGSDLVILPVQDILGTRDQINVPGTVRPENWTYRLPFAIEDAASDPAVRPHLERAARLAAAHGRLPATR